ncbi:dihydropteroate synthase [Aestuariivirga sp.]|uniref:dihydropteroate synthase n=1 Tax=Aestuariivirga sp. TaxID=2650926 RepID=UPI0039E46524
MSKVYYRPIGLSHGAAAVRAMSRGQAGRLGGHMTIAFHAVELIERREGTVYREIIPYTDLPKSDLLGRIEEKRYLGNLPIGGSPFIMGIVNVTPDSFSDGGKHDQAATAIAHGLTLAEDGAQILDVGGESTRPGSDAVPDDVERDRIVPVIRALAGKGHCISCDTRKASVMREAVTAGAAVINDVSALNFDPGALAVAGELDRPVVLMHAQGDPKTMQLAPKYDDVALDVYDYLEARIAAAREAGVSMIAADPGLGFGKTFAHNIEIMSQLTLFHGLGVPLLVGLSRKGFVGALTGVKAAGERVHGSVGGAVQAALNGAQIIRVHDVKATHDALAVALAAADPAHSGL